MSDPVTPLAGASFAGFATVRETGPQGMITLRCAHDLPRLAHAVKTAVGTGLPAPRRIVMDGAWGAGWMSPDELLLLCPRDQVPTALAALAQALAGSHHLAADVSDARAVFRVDGPRARDVLAKLTPADLAALAPHEVRRSRLAQVAAAFWTDGQGFTVITFRSVARYAFDVLANAARPGSEIGSEIS
jgi:sarcosine oxidase subunit gamma